MSTNINYHYFVLYVYFYLMKCVYKCEKDCLFTKKKIKKKNLRRVMLVYRNVVYCVAKILLYFQHDIKLLKNNQTNQKS